MPDSEETEPTLIRPAITAAPFLVTGRLLDQIPEVGTPFGLAFSIRRVYTGYRGKAMRVRRASDGAERDIGFVQTALDIEDLERHCAGFDGYVSIWYDQTGRGRHARQSVWSLQPRIVRGGKVVRDNLNNVALEFNGTYLVTDWEPKETEVGSATGMMTVASAGIGIQGQTGQIEQAEKDASSVSNLHFPEYPNEELPEGLDRFLLEATVVPDETEEDPQKIMVYRGRDKRLHVYNVGEESVTNLNMETASGPTFVTAKDVADETLSRNQIRGEAPDGTRAWRAAVEGKDGKIYGIPAFANRIVVIDPEDEEELESLGKPKVKYIPLPTDVEQVNHEKWYTGILAEFTGCIICPPYNQVQGGAAAYLIINTDPEKDGYQECRLFGSFGGASEMCRDIVSYQDDLFLVPFRDLNIRKMDLGSIEKYADFANVTNPGDILKSRRIEGRNGDLGNSLGGLFSSGVVAPNGKLYCTPWNIGTFLVVDLDRYNAEAPASEVFDVVGDLGMRVLIRGWGHEPGSNFVRRPSLGSTGDGYVVKDGDTTANFSVVISDPDFGTGQQDALEATVSAGRIVTGTTIVNKGDGYISTPQLRVREGRTTSITRASFRVHMTEAENGAGKKVDSIEVLGGGRGYRGSTPTLELRGGKGRQAVLRALFDRDSPAGDLFQIVIDDGGSGYFKPYIDDAEIVIGKSPNGQDATAVIDPDVGWVLVDESDPLQGYKLNQVNLVNRGTNYTRAPVVRLQTRQSGRPLQGYAASARVDSTDNMAYDMHVNSFSITEGGTNYETTNPNDRGNSCHIVAKDRLSDANETRVFWGGERFVADIEEVDPTTQAITQIRIHNAGRGYSQMPEFEVVNAPSNASGAQFQAIMKRHGMVTHIKQPSITAGYLTAPTFQGVTEFQKPGVNDRRVTFTAQFLPSSVGDIRTNEKWIQTVSSSAGNGFITGVPAGEHRMFLITNTSDPNPQLQVAPIEGIRNFRTKYASGVFDASGENFFCVPFDERRILRLSVDQFNQGGGGITFVGPQVRGRYSCAVRTKRNAIYCFPAETQDLLIIDPFDPRASEELQFGNLRENGRKFSDCVSVTRNEGNNGLLYALPDQTPFLLEVNPGLSLPRTPDLAPPNLCITLQDATETEPSKQALLFAPSPESATDTDPRAFAQLVLLDPKKPADRIEVRIPISPVSGERIPWFIQGVFCKNDQRGKVLFVPFYNVNSEHPWSQQNRLLMFDVQKLSAVLDQTAFTDPNATYEWDPSGNDTVYEWKDEVPFVFRPPYPSRSVVAFETDGGEVETVGWVPYGGGNEESEALNREPFVTYHFGDLNPGFRTKMGERDAAEPEPSDESDKRLPERVTWATASLVQPKPVDDKDRLVTMTYPVPRFSEIGTEVWESGDPRYRNARAVVVDDVLYAAPRRRNFLFRYDTREPSGSRLQTESFEDELELLFDSDKFVDTVYVPRRRELYFIPYDAPWFMVYELDAPAGERQYTFGQLDLSAEELPGLEQDLELDEDDEDEGRAQPNRALFTCAVLTPDSKILCIPENGSKAVLVNPLQDNFLERVERYIEIDDPGEAWKLESDSDVDSDTDSSSSGYWGRSMYQYAIVYQGNVYCIPWRAQQILKIDLQTYETSFVGDVFTSREAKWGQPTLHPDGKVYCAPYRVDTILSFWIDASGEIQTQLIEMDIGRTFGLMEGAVVGNDDYVYFTPRTSARNSIGFDPVSRETFLLGQYEWQGNFEMANMWQNAVKISDGRIMAMPVSYRNVLDIFPAANEFRTYRLGVNANATEPRGWYTEPLYTQRDFRALPIRSFRNFIGQDEPTPLLVFHTNDGYAIYDAGSADQDTPRAPTLVFSPTLPNGITGYFSEGREQTLANVVYRRKEDPDDDVYSIARVRFQRGAIAGVRGMPGSNLYAAVEGDDFTFYVGNGSLTIRGLYGIIYPDGKTGVYSGFARGGFAEQGPASGQVTAFIRGLSVGQRPYQWIGNASGGSTFGIGRVDEADESSEAIDFRFTAQFSGLLQELAVFQSNQLSRIRTLAENQTFAYNV